MGIELKTLTESKKLRYSPELKRVAAMYPAAVGAKNWRDIAKLANSGDVEGAKALAKADEIHPHIRRRNIMARRIRIERVELFARVSQATKELRKMLDAFTLTVTAKVNTKATSLSNLKVINAVIHSQTVLLRRQLNTWFVTLIKDATKMGFRHSGDALKPIFKHNQEAVTEIIAEQALFEAKLSFGLNADISSRGKPGVKQSSAKWTATNARIIRNITKKNLQGLTASERVWDLTSRTEADLKRIVANGIANGDAPYLISKRIEGYVSPSVAATDELGIETGPGVYRSPFRNAMRLARTETNRAYTQASAAFADGKSFIKGIQVTLSPEHDVEDECDDLADGTVMTAEEFADAIPAHPHCMCYGTYVIDEEYLGVDKSDSGDTSDEEDAPPPDEGGDNPPAEGGD